MTSLFTLFAKKSLLGQSPIFSTVNEIVCLKLCLFTIDSCVNSSGFSLVLSYLYEDCRWWESWPTNFSLNFNTIIWVPHLLSGTPRRRSRNTSSVVKRPRQQRLPRFTPNKPSSTLFDVCPTGTTMALFRNEYSTSSPRCRVDCPLPSFIFWFSFLLQGRPRWSERKR